ncbi:MAG: class I SAM-dependent methyltransferase [Myxococcales bacterium]|nr:class I SAM-dependent methyltransferase [Myxococcales bacterium]USN51836.1 MAG: class I SAM-dependent methyltransferase [Myxococcales bacterium]
MKSIKHKSAKASHYDKESESYDAFNENNSIVINKTIESILKKNKIKSVLDLSCGTGLQVFFLAEHGYDVTGCDINAKMLNIAKDKVKNKKSKIKFIEGDMRTSKVGTFDAVITIFNAIGHLTKKDFSKAIKNIGKNLKEGGLYIFDIFNLDYLLEDDNITKLTIDWKKTVGHVTYREIQYSSINSEGVLASFDIYIEQKLNEKPQLSKASQTLQVYSAQELKNMLDESGFKIMHQCGVDGSRFNASKSERILTVARKH